MTKTPSLGYHQRPVLGGTDPLVLTPLKLNDRLAAVVSPTAGPPPPLLRCAGANCRSWEFSATTPNGGSWPILLKNSNRECGKSRSDIEAI